MRSEIDDFPSTFCPRLWDELSVRPDSTIAPCCVFGKRLQDGQKDVIIEDLAPETSLESLPELVELRRRSLAGDKINRCSACYQAERNGGWSQRKWAVKGAAMRYPNAAPEQILENFSKSPGEHFSVHLLSGNLCNFRCRMCQPINSSRIAADPVQSKTLEALTGGFCAKVGLDHRQKKWHNDLETFRRKILPRLKAVRRLNLSGGEPLMSPILRKLLASDIDDDVARKCDVHITTNGSFCDDSILASLRRFKRHYISISIDGVSNTSEYIRNGVDWPVLVANARRFHSNGAEVRFNVTIQNYNILELPEIESFLEEEEYQAEMAHAGWVVRPYFLDPCKLPVEIKIQCKEILSGYLEKMEKLGKSSRMISYAINRLENGESANNEKASFKAFCQYTKELDLDRAESLAEGSPRLFSVLRDHPEFRRLYGLSP